MPHPAQSQTPSAPPSNNWANFPQVSQQFLQGCVGSQTLPPNQARIRQSYCRCALSAYQTRYSPSQFNAINGLVNKLGKESPTLVNLMMSPELDRCATQTGFQR